MSVAQSVEEFQPPTNENHARREFWRTARPKAKGADLLELSEVSTKTRRRNYHERTQRHYNLIIGKALSALGAPDCAQDYVTGFLTVKGYDTSGPVTLTDKEWAAKTLGKIGWLPKDEYTKRIKSEANRRCNQRRVIRAWQAKEGNPLIFDYDSKFNKKTGKNNSDYIFHFADLVRDIVADAPIGSSPEKIDDAVSNHCSDYLKRFTGTDHRPVTHREHSAQSEFARGLTLLETGIKKTYSAELCKLTKAAHPDAETLASEAAAEAFVDAFLERYPLDKYTLLHETLFAKLQKELGLSAPTLVETYRGSEGVSEIGHTPPTWNMSDFVDLSDPVEDDAGQESFLSELSGPEQPMPDSAPLVGQDADEFIAETFGDEGDPDAWRKLPTTPKQRDLLLRGNVFDIPMTRGEASDRINELIASGALRDWLSLADLQQYDLRGGGGGRDEKRYCCPLCAKSISDDHRDLSANIHTGKYHCHCCKAGGILREFCGPSSQSTFVRHFAPAVRTPAPKQNPDQRWRNWFASAKPIAGTPGADYLESRGIPVATAEAAGVRFGKWWRRNDEADKAEAFGAVIFPIRNPAGDLVAAQARATAVGDKSKRTKGDKLTGVFWATPGALDARVIAVTEAPIDALVLAACGVDAIAIIGTSWPAWLPNALAGRDVALAMDNDEPDKTGKRAGDDCAVALGSLLTGRASCRRLRPQGVKDWAELADLEGLDSVRAQLAAIFGDKEVIAA